MPFCDLALAFDAERRACDLVVAADGLVLDRTPLTAMLVSLGTDRRAEADDELPQPEDASATPAMLNARRGWWADGLDGLGSMGCRLWLLEREKQTEAVRRAAQAHCVEALSWIEEERSTPVTLRVWWVRPSMLGILVRAGASEIALQQPVLA